MGVVLIAEDPALSWRVAIKTIRMDAFPDPEQRAWVAGRFMQEARSLAQMSHPSIVTIYDIVEERDYIFIAMEYVDGGSVGGAQTAANGPLPADTCMRILRDTAAGLDYAHGRGIVHRDIKPANLLLHSSGQVKITDFGVAKLIGANSKTTAYTIVGTLDHRRRSRSRASKWTAGQTSFRWRLSRTASSRGSGRSQATRSKRFLKKSVRYAGVCQPCQSDAKPGGRCGTPAGARQEFR